MREQSNPGGRPWMSIILCLCCACAELAVIAEKIPRPGRGVGSNVTFDDLSDGIPRITESLYRRPRKKRVAKRFYRRQQRKQRLRFKTLRLSSFPSVSS